MPTRFIFLLFSCFFGFVAQAQMLLRGDTLHGNEWIDHDKTYYQMDVAEDGLHKITGSALTVNGIQLPTGEKWQMWFMGEEIPLYVSDDEDFGDEDMIIFYGHKNRSGLDSLLFPDKSDQLNLRYSLFTDTSSYYLTSSAQQVMRLQEGATESPRPSESLPYYRRTFHIDSNRVFHSAYLRAGTQKLYSSEFDQMSGFGSQNTASYRQTITLPNHVYDSEERIGFSLRLASSYSDRNEDLILRYQLTTDIFEEDSLKSFEVAVKSYTTDPRRSGQYVISISRLNHAGQRQYIVSHFNFEYPSAFILNENNAIQYNISATDENIVLNNIIPNAPYFIIDELNQRYDLFTSSTDTMKYAHPVDDGNYIIQQVNSVRSISRFTEINSQQSNHSQSNSFTILTSKKLYNQPIGQNPIDEYLNWRSSNEGGGFNAQLYFIEDLYDIYGYGVRRHPMALNNFTEVLQKNDPHGQLLIIGKGRAYSLVRTKEQLSLEENNTFYIPSFGFPPSDPLAISPIGEINPRLSAGRLAVSNLDEVAIYLNNVKQYETKAALVPSINPNWKKKMIHLSGGNAQANTVRKVFDKMTERIQRTTYAPEIVTFYKNSSIPVDSSQSDEIYNQINNGTSIVTFFGHSAPVTLGFRIDNENKYANAPLHPLFIALGCSAGNYNISSESVGETYCLMENKGFLNLISSTGISIVFNLDTVGRNLYELIGDSGNTLSHGQLLNETIKRVANGNGRRQAGQLSLFGDPSIHLNIPREKDITIDNKSIRLTPDFPSIDIDSVDFTFDILNLGQSPSQDVRLNVTRAYPSGNLAVLLDEPVSLTGFRTTINMRIPIERQSATGRNRLLITLDDANLIDEKLYDYSEENNIYIHSDDVVGFPFFIPSDGLTTIWPRDKSIVPTTEIEFFANSGNLSLEPQTFYLELDTSILFSSPAYRQYTASSIGGVVTFNPDHTYHTEVVYYWRVSPRPDAVTSEYFWTNHQSFVVLPNKEGWNISHYHQFNETEKKGLTLLPNHQWSFTQDFIPIRFGNGIWNSENQDQLGWFEFNNPFPTDESLVWEDNKVALAVMAFDHTNNRLINPVGGGYGSIPTSEEKDYFAFENTITGRDSLILFINQIIPDNFNVLFFTVRNNESDEINTSAWTADSLRNNGKNIYNTLEFFGAKDIRKISNASRFNYLSYFNKTSGHRFEKYSFDDDQVLTIDFNISQWGDNGQISLSNKIILPEDRSLLEWKFGNTVDSSDSYRMYAQIPQNSEINYLSDDELIGMINIDQLSDSIRLLSEFWSEVTDVNLKEPRPAQVEFFRMYGDVVGDFAIAPNLGYTTLNSSYRAYEPFFGAVSILNIRHSVNEITTRVYATHVATNGEFEFTNELLNVPVNQDRELNFSGQLNIPGEYILTIEINSSRTFNEATYFNNTLRIPITILADQSPPKLDVRFDDRHIFNGQIVSQTSEIKIELVDENNHRLLSEASLLTAIITQPDGSSYAIIEGDNAQYSLPTISDHNALSLIIKGDFIQEGTYHLSVDGRDVTGNQNDVSYDVDFQVFQKQGLGVTIYPNPVVEELFVEYVLFGQAQSNSLKLFITNAAGQTILATGIPLSEGHHEYGITIPKEWPSGLYQYQIKVKGEDGKEYAEYTDGNLGFSAGARSGQFVLLRNER